MKILLINPHIESRIVYGYLMPLSSFLPPLGLCYLASFLEKNNFTIKVIDLNVFRGDIINFIGSFEPDIIGVTAATIVFNSAKKLLKTIKLNFPDKITVLGGPHISALPLETMTECSDIDIGVIGEGEMTFCSLCDAMRSKRGIDLCQGVIFRRGNVLVRTDPMPLIENIDVIPFPDRHYLDNFNRYHHHFLREGRRTSSMITSRGCPHACLFCDQTIFGRRVRGHSPAYICEEIKMLKAVFHINFISFEDDCFNYNSERLKNVCLEIIKKNLDISWGCSVRIDTIDREDVLIMKKAGCNKVYIGIETMNKRIQKLINKQINESLLLEKIKMLKNFDIRINASFVIGFPTETKEEIEETIDKAVQLPIDGAFFCLYTPYPKTPLRKLAEKSGTVNTDWNTYSNHPMSNAFYPDTIEVKLLNKLLFSAYRRFYFSFKFFKKNCCNFRIFKHVVRFFLKELGQVFFSCKSKYGTSLRNP